VNQDTNTQTNLTFSISIVIQPAWVMFGPRLLGRAGRQSPHRGQQGDRGGAGGRGGRRGSVARGFRGRYNQRGPVAQPPRGRGRGRSPAKSRSRSTSAGRGRRARSQRAAWRAATAGRGRDGPSPEMIHVVVHRSPQSVDKEEADESQNGALELRSPTFCDGFKELLVAVVIIFLQSVKNSILPSRQPKRARLRTASAKRRRAR